MQRTKGLKGDDGSKRGEMPRQTEIHDTAFGARMMYRGVQEGVLMFAILHTCSGVTEGGEGGQWFGGNPMWTGPMQMA